jgi:hypothetical protein
MKDEYDFSKGVRGKFFHPNASLRLPIYLDSSLQAHFEGVAKKNGKDIGEIVNSFLKKRWSYSTKSVDEKYSPCQSCSQQTFC